MGPESQSSFAWRPSRFPASSRTRTGGWSQGCWQRVQGTRQSCPHCEGHGHRAPRHAPSPAEADCRWPVQWPPRKATGRAAQCPGLRGRLGSQKHWSFVVPAPRRAAWGLSPSLPWVSTASWVLCHQPRLRTTSSTLLTQRKTSRPFVFQHQVK